MSEEMVGEPRSLPVLNNGAGSTAQGATEAGSE
jgi:hypothetical protein